MTSLWLFSQGSTTLKKAIMDSVPYRVGTYWMKIRRENSRKKEPNDEKVGDLFQRHPDHLLVDVAAVHSVQIHVPFVQGSERRLSHLQPQVKYGVRSPRFIWAPCHVMYTSVKASRPCQARKWWSWGGGGGGCFKQSWRAGGVSWGFYLRLV